MTIKEINCQTWEEFKAKLLPELFDGTPKRGKYYFRGQGGANWPLMSSFDRWYKSANPEGVSKKVAAEKFLKLFRDEASRLTPDPDLGNDEFQTLALAQHYGIPTRLLDWTESPYVAAFFAFSGIAKYSERDSNVAIWCLDKQSSIWEDDTGIKLLSGASPYNERLKNQLGKFTLLQSPFDSVDDHINQYDKTGTILTKVTLPSSIALDVIADLDFMGINYSTIYPGLEGCAMAANLRMMFDK